MIARRWLRPRPPAELQAPGSGRMSRRRGPDPGHARGPGWSRTPPPGRRPARLASADARVGRDSSKHLIKRDRRPTGDLTQRAPVAIRRSAAVRRARRRAPRQGVRRIRPTTTHRRPDAAPVAERRGWPRRGHRVRSPRACDPSGSDSYTTSDRPPPSRARMARPAASTSDARPRSRTSTDTIGHGRPRHAPRATSWSPARPTREPTSGSAIVMTAPVSGSRRYRQAVSPHDPTTRVEPSSPHASSVSHVGPNRSSAAIGGRSRAGLLPSSGLRQTPRSALVLRSTRLSTIEPPSGGQHAVPYHVRR